MPIYEFKCLKCNEQVEFLVMNRDDEFEMKCANCDSADFERIISSTNYSIGVGAGNGSGTGSSAGKTSKLPRMVKICTPQR